jgi:hypothetical protein
VIGDDAGHPQRAAGRQLEPVPGVQPADTIGAARQERRPRSESAGRRTGVRREDGCIGGWTDHQRVERDPVIDDPRP